MLHSEEIGKWIWIAQDSASHNAYVYFRKTFDLQSRPQSASIRIAASSKYRLYVNGLYVGKGTARAPAVTAYYDTYDITANLTKGRNAIAVLVHHVGEPTYFGPAGSPGLNCLAYIQLEGQTIVIPTDETWKTIRARDWTDHGDRLGEKLGFQEVYDAGLRIEGWNKARFDEKEWENAVVVNGLQLVSRPIPILREEKILPKTVVGVFNCHPRGRETKPGSIPQVMSLSALEPLTGGGVKGVNSLLSDEGITHVRTPRGDSGIAIVLDFGREVCGNVEIGISGSSSGCVDVGYGELLQDGHVKPDRGGLRYTDRIILGKGRFEWQSFEPRAFRYMQIEFRWLGRPIAINYIRVNQTTYPVSVTGSFECSDSTLNQIWKTAVYTTELCMQDTFVASPWCDLSRNWADIRVAARTAYYAFGNTKLLAQALKEVAHSQTDESALTEVNPCGDQAVDLMLLWVLSVLEYYAFSNDLELVRELYPSVRQLMNWMNRHTSDDSLAGKIPAGLFIDESWLSADPTISEITALNCLYYHALRVSGALAGILGYADDAEAYESAANRVKLAINKHLYSPMRGLYVERREGGKVVEEFTRQTNIFAALFDVADHYRKSTIFRQMANGSLPRLETTYFASYLIEALCSVDLHEQALDYIRSQWGSMLDRGATTFWERFDGEGALCRGWSVCPGRDLIAEYLGIKPALEAGRFSVVPHTGGLMWARGSIETGKGPLKVEWRSTCRARSSGSKTASGPGRQDRLVIKVQVPPGIKVDVYPPGATTSKIILDGNEQSTRFVTLESGSHTIRVAPELPRKPLRTNKSLEPPPVPHVEVLEEIPQMEIRPLRIGADRERGERKSPTLARKTRKKLSTPADADKSAVAETPASPKANETPKNASEPKKRSRGRGRRKAAEEAVEAEALTGMVQAEETSVIEPISAKPETAAVELSKTSRQGGVRRRSLRKPVLDVEVQPYTEKPEVHPVTETEHLKREASSARTSRKKPSRRKKPDHEEKAI
ncbi:MAG: family 78 glycoside hydrolase catalytic domain [Armatimonadetes bacterium]|nr:family 78 glycoside hydrolase catalytic domain [Armatimonadota bacterium]